MSNRHLHPWENSLVEGTFIVKNRIADISLLDIPQISHFNVVKMEFTIILLSLVNSMVIFLPLQFQSQVFK